MEFKELITSIQEIDTTLSRRAASAVNVGLNARNWLVGAWIVEYEQKGATLSHLFPNQLCMKDLQICATVSHKLNEIRQTVSGEFYLADFLTERKSQTLSDQFRSPASSDGEEVNSGLKYKEKKT